MTAAVLRAYLGCIVIAVAVAACDEAGPTAPSRAEIVAGTWQLRTLERAGGSTVAVPSPDRFTLQFGDDGRLTMRADCNSCVGSYQLSATELRAGALACTRAFCGSDSLDQEFLRVFDGPAAIATLNDSLIISREGTRLTFRH